MSIIEMLLKEVDQEAVTTRKMLERVPSDKYDWRPHEKSMPIRQLAGHIAELPGWIKMGLTSAELDFATMNYAPPAWDNNNDLLAFFEKSLEEGRSHLIQATEADLLLPWTLRSGEKIHMKMNKGELIRHSLSQTIHHRAQLGVYLRLLDIPIPGSYGPSADEPNF